MDMMLGFIEKNGTVSGLTGAGFSFDAGFGLADAFEPDEKKGGGNAFETLVPNDKDAVAHGSSPSLWASKMTILVAPLGAVEALLAAAEVDDMVLTGWNQSFMEITTKDKTVVLTKSAIDELFVANPTVKSRLKSLDESDAAAARAIFLSWLTCRGAINLPANHNNSCCVPLVTGDSDANFRTVVFEDGDRLFETKDLRRVLRTIQKDLEIWESADTDSTESIDWVNPLIHIDERTRKDARGMMRYDLVDEFGARTRPTHKDKLCICMWEMICWLLFVVFPRWAAIGASALKRASSSCAWPRAAIAAATAAAAVAAAMEAAEVTPTETEFI
ncbi:hypothetical protein T492DRAFT_908982 [Pavlovales sp. CCMP2436]|nr:hypothetical protein T492DRAFT_908982 [Pavlovales sp. CCMP2436]